MDDPYDVNVLLSPRSYASDPVPSAFIILRRHPPSPKLRRAGGLRRTGGFESQGSVRSLAPQSSFGATPGSALAMAR
jgi:hypothetical protein